MREAIAAVAGWELRASIRSRWVLAGAGVFAGAALAVTILGLRSLSRLGLAGAGPASAGLLNLGILLPSLLGMLMGAGAIAGARERGLLAMMTAQPLGRGAVLGGTFLGLTAALWTILAAGLGLAVVLLGSVAGAADLVPVAALVGGVVGAATVSLAIGLALSCLSSGRFQATAGAVALWFVFAIGMDLALAGLVPALRIGPGGLLAAILVNPLEAARVLALLGADLQGAVLGPFGAYLVARFGPGGSALLLAGALAAWIAGALALARWALARRDV